MWLWHWSTGNIDFTTFPYEIMAGETAKKDCGAASGTNFEVTLPNTLPSTNYFVSVTLRYGGAGWGNVLVWKVLSKTTSSFTIQLWNPQGSTITSVGFEWTLVWLSS